MQPNPQETADLVTFLEELFNQKLNILKLKKLISSNSARNSLYWNLLYLGASG